MMVATLIICNLIYTLGFDALSITPTRHSWRVFCKATTIILTVSVRWLLSLFSLIIIVLLAQYLYFTFGLRLEVLIGKKIKCLQMKSFIFCDETKLVLDVSKEKVLLSFR